MLPSQSLQQPRKTLTRSRHGVEHALVQFILKHHSAFEIASAFQPLADSFATPAGFAAFMEQLGWEMDAVPPALSPLGDAAAQFRALLPDDGSDPSVPALLALFVLRPLRRRMANEAPAELADQPSR